MKIVSNLNNNKTKLTNSGQKLNAATSITMYKSAARWVAHYPCCSRSDCGGAPSSRRPAAASDMTEETKNEFINQSTNS